MAPGARTKKCATHVTTGGCNKRVSMPKGGLISGISSADALVYTTWVRDIRESGARPK